MRRCWASCLGNCSDKISGEHLISAGLFTQDSIRVKGLAWCRDDFKTVGLASLVRNVLCARHNSLLSEVDVGAIQLSKAILESESLSQSRNAMTPGHWDATTYAVNGLAFERWCLKTLITIAFGGSAPIGNTTDKLGEPSPELVQLAFGLRHFEMPRAGLYWLGDVGGTPDVGEGVVVSTFLNAAQCLAGARFWFFGMTFLLILGSSLPAPFTFTSIDGKETTQPNVVYRPRRIGMDVKNRRSHVFSFGWGDFGRKQV
jgi:hypothetical protein